MGSEMKMKVEVLHIETIKPSSPTPHHLKTTNLSVFDQLSPDVYIPLLLFYPNNPGVNNNIDSHEKLKILKSSLSETLARFYPFAGKFQYNVSISSNDHGVAFLEAQINCPMSSVLDTPDVGVLKQLLPTGIGSTTSETGFLLLFQANFFACGGLAIGISSSHIVTDAYTLSTFLQSWSAIAQTGSTPTESFHVMLPSIKFGAAASLFPPLDILNSPKPALKFDQVKCITKRFVFDGLKIAALKSKAASATVPNPTRVEALSALVWKCATEASRSNRGVVRPSEWSPVANIRKVLVKQPLAESLMGNLVGDFTVRTEANEIVGIDFGSSVAKLRKGVGEFKAKYGNGVRGEEACEFFKGFGNLMKRDIDKYECSSWCRFPFYETNFGWGKPLWVCQVTGMKNLVVFMDTRDGKGVEVSFTLNVEDMAAFESNSELLAYASVNPSVM